MRTARRKLTIATVICALGAAALVPNVSASSTEPDSRAAFFDRYQSLAEYSSAGGRDPEGWMPSTRIPRKSWGSAVADESVRVDRTGRVLVVEPEHSEFDSAHSESTLDHGSPQAATPVDDIALSQAFQLNSLPGANRTIYLDFTGHSLVGTVWQTNDTESTADDYTNAQMLMPPYSVDGDTTRFSAVERRNIIDTWSAVAEDYAPFAVNVTTAEPSQSALNRTDLDDLVFGARAVITDSGNVIQDACGCGGLAYVGVFNLPGQNSYYGPSLSFSDPGMNGKTLSDIVSHEVGHNVGLLHDGTATAGYYVGRDGWAPIMGVGYYEPLVQFSDGSYTDGNELQDDFAIATATGLPLRVDDHGDIRADATPLTLGTEDEGIISTRTDVDYFSFTASGTSHDITVTLPSFSANLDVQLTIYDSSGTLVSTTNPDFFRLNEDVATGLDAFLTATTTPGVVYYLEVDGVGFGPGTTTGYSDYGSRGEYRIVVPLATIAPTATPAISGTKRVGRLLTVSAGTWMEGTTLSQRWLRNGSRISGATGTTYKLRSADRGKRISVRVTVTKPGFASVTTTSTRTSKVRG